MGLAKYKISTGSDPATTSSKAADAVNKSNGTG